MDKKESKKHHHHHEKPSKKMGSKNSTPVAPGSSEFPTTGAVASTSGPKSCVIMLVQNSATFPNNNKTSEDSAAESRLQIYEKWWRKQLSPALEPVTTAVHLFEVNKFLNYTETVVPSEIKSALVAEMQRLDPAAVIATHISHYPLIGLALQASRGSCFTIMADETVSLSGELRLLGTDVYGTHMASHVPSHITKTLNIVCAVPPRLDRKGTLDCPYCSLNNLTQLELWHHCSTFHIMIKKQEDATNCPICKCHISNGGLYVHIHDDHAPPGTHLDQRPDVKLYSFGLCVIRRKKDGRFLCCVEYSNAGLWLPGGGIDAGEAPWTGAERECLEEAGVAVNLKGVLKIEISSQPSGRGGRGGYCRQRYIFYGEPKDENDCEPKTFPDFESQGACWVSLEELSRCRLRGYEPAVWFKAVSEGCPIYPMKLFGLEGDDEPNHS